MEYFSQKSLLALGEYYVYGLIDPRTNQFFYIGKGSGNRVFQHEMEALHCEGNKLDSAKNSKLKLRIIADIHAAGLQVKKVILNCNLTESEAFAAEAALINAFRYVSMFASQEYDTVATSAMCDGNEIFKENGILANEVAGHHFAEALSVEEFERKFGAEDLREEDIKHKIMVIKINQLYRKNMSPQELYDAVRGKWVASIDRARNQDYVFGVYNSLIVAVFKPTEWHKCKDAPKKAPRPEELPDPRLANRIFFVDENFERALTDGNEELSLDENAQFYLYKSIRRLYNGKAQNPISYLP